MIDVVLLGSGNVAQHLYKAFSKAEGVRVVQWYARNTSQLQTFKQDTAVTNSLDSLVEAHIYIMAISDDALAEVSTLLPFENRLVVHTSGSVNVHDLDKKHKRGVFYPLQTFSKEAEVDFSTVPLCMETIEKDDYQHLQALADCLHATAYKISTEQRQTLHLAAVFANNFTNQLYRIAHELTDAKHIPFDILKPLIKETANKMETLSPYMAQTGPAKRHDKKTIKRHLKLLENPQHKAIYELLTQAIKRTHGR